MKHRAVDLGREDHLVTWADWFARVGEQMSANVPEDAHDSLQFRVTLIDGRQFLVVQMLSHVSRGKCSLEPTRWEDQGAVCDVITGYILMGFDEHETPTTISIAPADIASVECILPVEEAKAPFGFALHAERLTKASPLKEVEEKVETAQKAN